MCENTGRSVSFNIKNFFSLIILFSLLVLYPNSSAFAIPRGQGEGGAQDEHEMSGGESNKQSVPVTAKSIPIKKSINKIVAIEDYETEYLNKLVEEAAKKNPEEWTHKEIVAMGRLVHKELEKEPFIKPEVVTDPSQPTIRPAPKGYLSTDEMTFIQKKILNTYSDKMKDTAMKSLGASSKVIKGVGIVTMLMDSTAMGNSDDTLLDQQMISADKQLVIEISASYEQMLLKVMSKETQASTQGESVNKPIQEDNLGEEHMERHRKDLERFRKEGGVYRAPASSN